MERKDRDFRRERESIRSKMAMQTETVKGYEFYNLRSRGVVPFTPSENLDLLWKKSRANKVRKPQNKADSEADVDAVKTKIRCIPRPLTAAEVETNLKQEKSRSRALAVKALPFYNRGCKEKGKPKYELVNACACVSDVTLFPRYFLYHVNFEARPKKDPNAQVELFFAEVLLCKTYKVRRCSSLGLKSSESAASGSSGCTSCEGIHHPRDGVFEKCEI